jgi:hypothetical protein
MGEPFPFERVHGELVFREYRRRAGYIGVVSRN